MNLAGRAVRAAVRMGKGSRCALVSGALLVSCFALGGAHSTHAADPGSAVSSAPPCKLGLGTVDVVIDVTYSTESYVVAGAQSIINRNLDDLIKHPECGRHIYIEKLGRESTGLGNNVMTANVPPIAPIGPMPTQRPGESAYLYQQRLNAWKVQNHAVSAEKAKARRAVASIKAEVKKKVDPKRIRPEKEGQSDIRGAFVKFSEFIQGLRGPNYLLVLSDLVEAGPQTPGPILLPKTKVNLVQSCSGQYPAAKCEQITSYWQSTLKKAGARPLIITQWEGRDFVDDAFDNGSS